MPPSAIVHGGMLPLNSFSFRPKSKSRTSPLHEFTWELMLDSTRLLSGLLKSYGNVVEYAIATSGSKTVISRPSRSTNVAVIEWKEGWAHVFKKWGKNPEILWEVKGGDWEATNTKKQVLAAFVVRRGALGSRIELTDLGRPFADALVLTGILIVTGEEEWRWHTFLQARRDQLIEGTSAAVPESGAKIDGSSA
ncbi:hypothetical protein BN14_11109 [Rhizoctonia solani AG-1 IB]|uniref:Uncharacterized protein n=1 Tax=Thanatephorus cucumeris (strain AG1-IB / isolate 7/3/14) TaxID=1108050 RepID=M5CCU4_THACB|nr:hypothetical protein BN14_11109 [Rhizoctonia solani AG-1 IB]